MPPAASRELKYQVTLTADTKPAEQSLARVAAATERVTKTTAAALQELARFQQISAGGGGMAGGAYVPAAASSASEAEKAAKAAKSPDKDGLSLAAMAVKAAFVVQSVANVMDAFGNLGNSMMGARDKLLGFVGSVPLIGDALSSITANMLNFVERLETDGAFDRKGIGGLTLDTMRYGVSRTIAKGRAGEYENLGNVGKYDRQANELRQMPYLAARYGLGRDNDFRLQDIGARDESLIDRARRSEVAVRQANAIRYAPDRWTGGALGRLFGIQKTPGRFDEDDGYDATIRGAHASRIGVQEGRNAAADQLQVTERMRDEQELKMWAAQRRSDKSASEAEKASAAARGDDGIFSAIKSTISEQGLKLTMATAEKDRAEYLKEAARLEQIVQKSKEEQLQLTQAESALRKANVAISQAELQVAQQKRAELKGDLSQFGQMDAGRQEALRQAALRSKEVGYQELTPEEKALLAGSGLTAKYAAERAQKSAEESPQARDILAAVGRQDMKAFDAKVAEIQTTVKAKLQIDAEELKAELQEQLTNGLSEVFRQAVDTVFRVRIREIDLKMQAATQSRK